MPARRNVVDDGQAGKKEGFAFHQRRAGEPNA
jgi:hypothetical protein